MLFSPDLCCQGTYMVARWLPATRLMTLPSTRMVTTARQQTTVSFVTWPWCILAITPWWRLATRTVPTPRVKLLKMASPTGRGGMMFLVGWFTLCGIYCGHQVKLLWSLVLMNYHMWLWKYIDYCISQRFVQQRICCLLQVIMETIQKLCSEVRKYRQNSFFCTGQSLDFVVFSLSTQIYIRLFGKETTQRLKKNGFCTK